MNASPYEALSPPMSAGCLKFLKIGESSTSPTRREPSKVWLSGGAVKPA
jgi:hypothetical protein